MTYSTPRFFKSSLLSTPISCAPNSTSSESGSFCKISETWVMYLDGGQSTISTLSDISKLNCSPKKSKSSSAWAQVFGNSFQFATIYFLYMLVFQMLNNKPNYPENNNRADDNIKFLEILVETVPMFSGGVAGIGQTGVPNGRTDQSISVEFFQIHPGHTGGQRAKGANYRQNTGPKNSRRTVTSEPVIGLV